MKQDCLGSIVPDWCDRCTQAKKHILHDTDTSADRGLCSLPVFQCKEITGWSLLWVAQTQVQADQLAETGQYKLNLTVPAATQMSAHSVTPGLI
jgi:hypothetical protein